MKTEGKEILAKTPKKKLDKVYSLRYLDNDGNSYISSLPPCSDLLDNNVALWAISNEINFKGLVLIYVMRQLLCINLCASICE